MNRKAIILRLFALLGLAGVSYLLARILAAAWIPHQAARLIFGLPPVVLALPGAYWLLARRYRHASNPPYWLLPPDVLLPGFSLLVVAIVLLVVLPRFAVWTWGATTDGSVQALRTETSFDPDLLLTREHYRVDYTFTVGDRVYRKSSYVGRNLYATLAPGDALTVHYAAWQPHIVTAGDPLLFTWQATFLLWGALLSGLWLAGTAVATPRRTPPPPPPPFPAPQTAVELLARYGLDTLLSAADDAKLWAAVVGHHFPMPQDEAMHVAGLRFGLGQLAPAARLKIQPTALFCFDVVDAHHLKPANCRPDAQTDADVDEALAPLTSTTALYLDKLPRELRPLRSIVVPRPSVGEERVAVYTAVMHANGNAFGETAAWARQPDGAWRHTQEKLNWWMRGA